MTISLRFLALTTFLIATVAAHAQCVETKPGAPPPFSIDLVAEQDSVKTGSPAWVKVTLTNKSDHDIIVFRTIQNYQVDVRDETGTLTADTKLGRSRNGHVDSSDLSPQELTGSGACLTIKAGQSLKDKIDVSTLYDLSKPGKYAICVVRFDEESGTDVKSKTITVTVMP
jgi:hypothetical protein